MINFIDSAESLPYLFISCSDDETVKIWGVQSQAKVEVVQLKDKSQLRRLDIKNEVQEEQKANEV
jgi:hypothetical protein